MPRNANSRRRPKHTSAAFFDLDRTLLAGASGPVFTDALRSVGVLPERRNPLEPVLFKIFDLLGENYPSMVLSREGARATKGWSVEKVRRAAKAVVPELLNRLQPYARVEIEEHRSAGRALVLATTTPEDWIRPFAEALDFDHVIATSYGNDGTTYDGTIAGEFVWGKGKARAVRAWAEEAGIALSESSAYSDSYYDVPLLSIVGHPNVVNPDPRMMVVSALRRWPTRYFDVPPGVPKLAGMEPQRVAMLLARPELLPFVRFRIYGSKRIPETGPAIIVGNHRSYFDPLAIGVALGRRGRPVRFLGKKEVFDAPIVGDFAAAMGGIRVDRGTGSGEPLRAATEALAAGDMVAVMPQGTIPRGREFFNPVLHGRWGAARLAAATGAPIVPIGLWGTEMVWPRSSRLPNLANIANPPTVTVRIGAPFHLEGSSLDDSTATIMEAITSLLPPAARVQREPTAAEVARALPPGAEDAPTDHEAGRRPGAD